VAIFHTYQQIVAWQLAEGLREEVARMVANPEAGRDVEWCRQITRSTRAAPTLIAEGFGRNEHRREFARYLVMAKGELFESQSHLRHGRVCDARRTL
jgi:four helix bundle protein